MSLHLYYTPRDYTKDNNRAIKQFKRALRLRVDSLDTSPDGY